MKLFKQSKFILIAGLAVTITSCSDETSDPEPTTKSKTDLLTASAWIMTSATVDPALDIGGTQVTDFYSQMDACDKDDLTKYDANKTGIYDEGATKCDPTDPQTSTFNWTWDLTESKITEDGETYEVETLTETALKSSIIFDGDEIGGVSGINYKLTATFKH